jgi:hypothetical protein
MTTQSMMDELCILKGIIAEARAKIDINPKESNISSAESDLIEILDRLNTLEKRHSDAKYVHGT